jgi:hypothetical protein
MPAAPSERESPAERPEPERDLATRLREADADELVGLLRRHASELDVAAARQALRNPFLGREGVERIAAEARLLTAYEVKRSIVRHPQTPEVLAMRFVPGLFWRDLVELGIETRVRPTVRRAADRTLAARLPGLASGEKLAIARRGSPRILERLRHDPSPAIVRALMENPRATEGVILPLITHDDTRPDVLQAVARSRRWGARYEVRLALARHPHTPLATALGMLPHLRKADLRKLAAESRVPAPVRRRAEVLLGTAT